jgi:hypothetical protein
MLPSAMTWDATCTHWVPVYDRYLPRICICVNLPLYAVHTAIEDQCMYTHLPTRMNWHNLQHMMVKIMQLTSICSIHHTTLP